MDRMPKCGRLAEGKLLCNNVLTCGGANQLKSSGKGRFDHLACINAPLRFSQVE